MFLGIARGPVWVRLSFSFSKLPMHAMVSRKKLASSRTSICCLLFFSMWLKVLTGGSPSRLFSLGFLFLVLKVHSSCNINSALFCALQLIAGMEEMTHVYWPNTGVQDL